MTNDLASLGLDLGDWTSTVEAAVGSTNLAVAGLVRDGQLIQFADPSGAVMNILTVEPYSVFTGFAGQTMATGHITMVTDIVALIDIIDDNGYQMASVTANLSQGPLLADGEPLQFTPVELTAIALTDTPYGEAPADATATVSSPGVDIIASGDGSQVPDAAATLAVQIVTADYRTTELTGQRFIHAVTHAPFPMDLCLPDAPQLPAEGTWVTGRFMLTASVAQPAVGAGGCGCGGSCGCGGHH
ncbi:MAG: hypothetical protein SPI77_08420 [Corynebacterium sp.]|nr:hypothetical protein [Corynebacterium sp.]